jgi:hypothetical protein
LHLELDLRRDDALDVADRITARGGRGDGRDDAGARPTTAETSTPAIAAQATTGVTAGGRSSTGRGVAVWIPATVTAVAEISRTATAETSEIHRLACA